MPKAGLQFNRVDDGRYDRLDIETMEGDVDVIDDDDLDRMDERYDNNFDVDDVSSLS